MFGKVLGLIKNRGFGFVFQMARNICKQYGFSGLFKAFSNKIHGLPLLWGLSAAPQGNIISKEALDLSGIEILREQQEEVSLEKQRQTLFQIQPKLSVLMPMYNAPPKWLECAIQSIKNQSYINWELCIVNDGSTDLRGESVVKKEQRNDGRIRYKSLPQNKGISAATNCGLEMAEGEYVVLVDQDDELTPDAFFWMVDAINRYPDGEVFYSDECKTGSTIKPSPTDFYFKPDWSPELLINHMYVGHLTIYRTELVRQVGGFRSKYDFSQDYDLILRVSACTEEIYHVERVLYYWRTLPTSGASGGKDYARISNLAALQDRFQYIQIDAVIQPEIYANYIRCIRRTDPLVSIVIPTDSFKNLSESILGILRSTYSNLEIIPVVNSKVAAEIEGQYPYLDCLRVCRYDKIYNFSDKCNEGAKAASGEYIIFYNDDVCPILGDWIERQWEILQLPGVGGVSPTLLGPTHQIQYSGMIAGTPGMVGTAFNGVPFDFPLGAPYNHKLLRNVSVLCGACMMMRKELFDKIGGFDAAHTPNGHSDFDISMKILQSGSRCVCTPYSVLLHMGNHSWEEEKYVDKSDIFCIRKWGAHMERDPYFTDSMKRHLYRDYPGHYKIYHAPNSRNAEKENSRDILILTHQLNRTGAPIVLKALAKVFLDRGDFPVLMSPIDGPLREDFLEMGVTVIIDESMSSGHWLFEHFARNFDLVVANTLGASMAVKALSDSLPPILWWIHEGEYAFKCFAPQLPKNAGKNTKIYPGGEYVRRFLKAAGLPCQAPLYYGIPKDADQLELGDGLLEKNLFLLVGSIEKRKGQDILLAAIRKLPQDHREKAKFCFVGEVLETGVQRRLDEAMLQNPNIEVLSPMSKEDLYKLYAKCAAVVIPSRDDPMPVVGTDAFMLGKLCICSDHTGTAALIEDGVNGFTFPNEDADALSQILQSVMDHPDRVRTIGDAGKQIYENMFTFESFRERIATVLREDFAFDDAKSVNPYSDPERE